MIVLVFGMCAASAIAGVFMEKWPVVYVGLAGMIFLQLEEIKRAVRGGTR